MSDAAGKLAVGKLDIQIGSRELAAISLTGDIDDVSVPQGVNLNFSAQGQDSASLSQLGFPELPERGAFQVSAQISDPAPKVYTVRDLRAVLGDNEIDGQIDLNLAEKIPLLTAGLTSQKFRNRHKVKTPVLKSRPWKKLTLKSAIRLWPKFTSTARLMI